MNSAHFRKLARYTRWADTEIMRCASHLTDEQLDHDFGYSVGPVRAQIYHLAGVEYWWFHFLATDELDFFGEEEPPSIQRLGELMALAHGAITAFTEALTDSELMREVKPVFWKADSKPFAVWEAMIQVFNHSTDHRAQALFMLHRLGAPTFMQDYLFMEHPELTD